MIQVEGNCEGPRRSGRCDLRQLFFPRDPLPGARLETVLPVVLALGFDEKMRSQPDENFSDVPVWTV
jgi:hypothetical protein